jgi:hypothetical protein
VLAVAAFETGKMPVALRALDEAEQRGTDMSALRRLLPPIPSENSAEQK